MRVLILSHDDVARGADARGVRRGDGVGARRPRPRRGVHAAALDHGPAGRRRVHGADAGVARRQPSPCSALKAICVMPGNPARGLDAHQGIVTLFDGETGVADGDPRRLGGHRDPHRGGHRGRHARARARGRPRAGDPRRRRPGALSPRGAVAGPPVRRTSASTRRPRRTRGPSSTSAPDDARRADRRAERRAGGPRRRRRRRRDQLARAGDRDASG